MKLEKVSENQIRCTLTREDLVRRQLKISELAYGTEKAKVLFRDMMQQANFEFGFEAEDIPLMIEAIPMSSECIVLIITKVEDPEELDTRFSRFAPSVTEDAGEDSPVDEIRDLFRRISKDADLSIPTPSDSAENDEADRERTLVFHMNSLQQVIAAASVVGASYRGYSALYRDSSDAYLLVLTCGGEEPKSFDRICNIISEYGTPKRSSQAALLFLKEHGTPILPDDALQNLAKVQ